MFCLNMLSPAQIMYFLAYWFQFLPKVMYYNENGIIKYNMYVLTVSSTVCILLLNANECYTNFCGDIIT